MPESLGRYGRCPFAVNPDATGVDCDCKLPWPSGMWARFKRFMHPWCVTGAGGCGDGSLPCDRYEKWRKSNGHK